MMQFVTYYALWLLEAVCLMTVTAVGCMALREPRRHNYAKELILSEIRDRLPLSLRSN